MRCGSTLPAVIALMLGSSSPALAQEAPGAEPVPDAGAIEGGAEGDATGGLEQAPGTGLAPPDEAAAQDDPGVTTDPDAAIQAGESITAPDVPTTMPIDEETVRGVLEAEGFTEVGEVVRDGETFEAQAMRDGKPYTVRIDARTRTILEAQEG